MLLSLRQSFDESEKRLRGSNEVGFSRGIDRFQFLGQGLLAAIGVRFCLQLLNGVADLAVAAKPFADELRKL